MYYSQFGEDKILSEIFQGKKYGVCIDVGANDGAQDSNSFFFEKAGWKCVLVEPNPFLCDKLRLTRPNSLIYEYAASNQHDTETTLHIVDGEARSDGLSTISTREEDHNRIKNLGFTSRPIQIRTMTLDKILADAQIDGEIDFVSIDVEGHEIEVLKGFSIKKWKPVIILIEDNSKLSSNIVCNYLKEFGYTRFRRTGVNDWYASHSNTQLINIRSTIYILGIILKAKINNGLKKIPILRKFKRFLIKPKD